MAGFCAQKWALSLDVFLATGARLCPYPYPSRACHAAPDFRTINSLTQGLIVMRLSVLVPNGIKYGHNEIEKLTAISFFGRGSSVVTECGLLVRRNSVCSSKGKDQAAVTLTARPTSPNHYVQRLVSSAMSLSLLKFAGQASLVDEAMLPS